MPIRRQDPSTSATSVFSTQEMKDYGLNGGGGGLSRRLKQEKDAQAAKEQQLTSRIGNDQSRLIQSGITPPEPDKSHGIFQSLLDGLNYLGNKKNQGLMALSGGPVTDEVTGKDLLKRWSGGKDFSGSGVAGFAFDAVTDPLNLLSFGTAGAAAQGAKTVGRGALTAFGKKSAKDLAEEQISLGAKEAASARSANPLDGVNTKGTFVERLNGSEGDKLREVQTMAEQIAKKHGLGELDLPSIEKMVAENQGHKIEDLYNGVYGSGPRNVDAFAPKPWEMSDYAKSGKVQEVSVDFLSEMAGNPLRHNEKTMNSMVEDIRLNGIREPLVVFIGQKNRQVLLGEGNHRLEAAKQLGYQYVPVRVMRQQEVKGGLAPGVKIGQGDNMSKVPTDGYFPGDAKPSDVFDNVPVKPAQTDAPLPNATNVPIPVKPINDVPPVSPFAGVTDMVGGLDDGLRKQVDTIIQNANGDTNHAAQMIEELANTPDVRKASRQMRMQEMGIQGKVAHNLAKYMAKVDDTYTPEQFTTEVLTAMKSHGMSDGAIGRIMGPAEEQARAEALDHAIGHAVDSFGGSSVKADVLLEGDLMKLKDLSETLPQPILLNTAEHLRKPMNSAEVAAGKEAPAYRDIKPFDTTITEKNGKYVIKTDDGLSKVEVKVNGDSADIAYADTAEAVRGEGRYTALVKEVLQRVKDDHPNVQKITGMIIGKEALGLRKKLPSTTIEKVQMGALTGHRVDTNIDDFLNLPYKTMRKEEIIPPKVNPSSGLDAVSQWTDMNMASRIEKITTMGISKELAQRLAANQFDDLPPLVKNTLNQEADALAKANHPLGSAYDEVSATIKNFPRPVEPPVKPGEFISPPGGPPAGTIGGVGDAAQAADKGKWFAQLGGHIPFTNIGGYVKVPGSETVLSALGDTASKGLSQLGRIPGATEFGKAVKDFGGKLFVRGYGVPGAVSQLTQSTAELTRMDAKDIVDNMVKVRQGWVDSGYVPAVDDMKILEGLEDPTVIPNLTQTQKDIVSSMRDFFDIHLTKAQDAGVIDDFRMNYLPHIFKGKQADVSNTLKSMNRLRTNIDNGLDRMFDIPLTEIINDPVLNAKLKPETNPIKLMATFKQSLELAIRNNDMLTDLAALGPDIMRKDKSEVYNAATGSWDSVPGQIPMGWVKAPVTQLKNYWVPPEVASHLNDMMQPFTNNEGFQKLMHYYDSVLGWWKGMATVPNVGFQVRNVTGNMFNNYLAGVRTLDNYKLAREAQMADDTTMDYFYDLIRQQDNRPDWAKGQGVAGGANLPAEIGVMDDTVTRIMERVFNDERFAQKFFMGGGTKIPVVWEGKQVMMNMTGIKLMAKLKGVTGAGYFSGDLGAEVMKRLDPVSKLAKFNPLDPRNIAFKGLEKTGTWLEDNTRLAHFISKLRTTGGKMDEAAMSTKKYLFDYSRLTPFEKNVMKRIMPFYAFTRNNLPMQLQELVKQPKYAGQMATFQNYMDTQSEESTGTPLNRDNLPKYINQLYSVRLPFQVGNESRDVVLGMDVPLRDVNSFSFNEVMSMMTPLLTVPYERLANRNFFTGRDLESYQGETTRAPGYLQGVFKVLQTASPDNPDANIFNKAFQALGGTVATDKDGNPELRIGVKGAHLLNQVVSAKNAGKAVDFATGDASDPFNISSMLTGVSAVSSSEQQRNLNGSYNQLQVLDDLMRKLGAEGQPVPTLQDFKKKDPKYLLQQLLNGSGATPILDKLLNGGK